jgi:GNAT superfamily N-acetyltransferase
MLPPDTIDEINNYWVAHLGCPPSRLFEARVVVLPHSTFKGYQGLFLVRRGDSCIVTAPSEMIHLVHTAVHGRPVAEVFGSGLWRQVFADVIDRVVGPASLAYCDASTLVPDDQPGTLPLGGQDHAALTHLRHACGEEDWDRSGILPNHPVLYGHWIGGELVSAAGFELWGDRIAHMGVVTHPAHRGKGYAKAVVTALTRHAIEQGLVSQYRTIESNVAALSVGRALGYEEYAKTFAIGLNVDRIQQLIESDRHALEENPDDDPGFDLENEE